MSEDVGMEGYVAPILKWAVRCDGCRYWDRWSWLSATGVAMGECKRFAPETPERPAWPLPDAGADDGSIATLATFACNEFTQRHHAVE